MALYICVISGVHLGAVSIQNLNLLYVCKVSILAHTKSATEPHKREITPCCFLFWNSRLHITRRRPAPLVDFQNYSDFIVGRVAQSVQRLSYGLDGPGFESRWGEIFSRPDLPWGPLSLLYNGYRVFPGGKERPGRAADHSPISSAVVMEE